MMLIIAPRKSHKAFSWTQRAVHGANNNNHAGTTIEAVGGCAAWTWKYPLHSAPSVPTRPCPSLDPPHLSTEIATALKPLPEYCYDNVECCPILILDRLPFTSQLSKQALGGHCCVRSRLLAEASKRQSPTAGAVVVMLS